MGTQNSQVVKGIYDAFGRGDIDAVLDSLADDIEWDMPGPAPYAGIRQGRDQVRQFFADLDRHLRLEQFDVDDVIAEGEKVVVLGRERGSVRETGATFEQHWAHVYTMRGARIAAARFYEDTHAQASAFGETNREREAVTGPLGVTQAAYSEGPER